MRSPILNALVQNYGFKQVDAAKLPTIDYVYPDFVADGNTEAFRFSHTLRCELAERAGLVRTALSDKEIVWSARDEAMLQEIDKVSPRLGIDELISGKINSIYSGYSPILFHGANDSSSISYVVKPIVNGQMAWFELTPPENDSVSALLKKKAEDKPYRTLAQRIFRRIV